MASSHRSARTAVLREVLDVALAVGRRVEAEGRGPVPVPLRPVLGMSRVGSRALAAVDRAGDDDGFRAQVAEAVDPDELDEAGRLWLLRPDGWEDALAALVDQRAAETSDGEAGRALERERRARRRAEEARDRLQVDLHRATAELADLPELRTRLAEAEARADTLPAAGPPPVRQLKDLESLHQRAHEELRSVRAELADARAEAAAAATETPPPEPVIRSPLPAGDPITGSEEIAAAAGAAAELARTLEALAASLRPEAPKPARPRHAPRRSVRRRPALPGGVHDDSPEAADHLVRLPGAALLVDGYNASMSTWPGRDLGEQRRRLVDALDQLEARVGVHATVVFDGVEPAWRRSASRRVDIRFTPAGVEADDVILDLVDALPDGRPVVVASDDNRVRAGARQRGAHPIGTDQLRSLLA